MKQKISRPEFWEAGVLEDFAEREGLTEGMGGAERGGVEKFLLLKWRKKNGRQFSPPPFVLRSEYAYFFLPRAANASAIAPRIAAIAEGSGTVKATFSDVSPKTASHWIPPALPSKTVPAIELPVS